MDYSRGITVATEWTWSPIKSKTPPISLIGVIAGSCLTEVADPWPLRSLYPQRSFLRKIFSSLYFYAYGKV